ncbi:MAG: hypothetical protein HYV96_05195 [Opitutae bacterium]|nr:hypothetical protein [Opitutae bacterium]
MADQLLPQRHHLPHEVPPWVKRGARYFITICCQPRGTNQLCHPNAWAVISESVACRQARVDWHMRLLLAMPDHLHALVSFPEETVLRKTTTDWKSLLARSAGIKWQRDFFEHRLRVEEQLDLKARYIRENPVRAGLVAKCEDWFYVWESEDGGPGRSALPPIPEP